MERLDAEEHDGQQKRCAAIVSRFMELELDKDDLFTFLSEYVLPTANEIL